MADLIVGIDPGPERSGFCVWCPQKQRILHSDHQKLNELIFRCVGRQYAMEDIEYRKGANVGKTVFDTCKTIGRLQERLGVDNIAMYRKSAVSNHFRGLQLLKQRYPKGTKKNPGITYNLVAHSWDAFALCIFHQDKEIGL